MHFFHEGTYDRFKKLSTLMHRCCICGQYSDCTIERWRSWLYFSYIPIWRIGNGYQFTWKACNHAGRMDDSVAIQRYKEEQEDTGMFSIPLCEQLKPMYIEPPMAFNLKNILLLSPFILIILVGLIYICLQIATGIR